VGLVVATTSFCLGQIGQGKVPAQPPRQATPQVDRNGQITTTFNDSRPLARAADLVAFKLDISVSYEEPAWVWKDDLAYAAELSGERSRTDNDAAVRSLPLTIPNGSITN